MQAFLLVGASEMGHQSQRGDARRRRQAIDDLAHFRGVEAQAIHAGIDLDEHFQRARKHGGLQHAHVLYVVHNYREAARRDFGQLVGTKESFQQQNAARIVMLTQQNGGVELEQCKSVGVAESGQDT